MSHGTFSGEPHAIWLTEDGVPDRRMKLLKSFSFVDPAGTKWSAKEGAVIDGASIPRALWTTVGSPYTGDYRRASILHDVACNEAGQNYGKRLAADRMFYRACRAGGCSILASILLYIGVRIGAMAPRVQAWHAAVASDSSGPRIRRADEELQLERDFATIADSVLAPGATDDPAEIERRFEASAIEVAGLLPRERRTKASAGRRIKERTKRPVGGRMRR